MKIISIDILRLNNGKGNFEGGTWAPICLRINTDEGISGYAEAGLAYGNASNAAFGILLDFGKLVIGEDPMCIEAIWNKLHRKTFWGSGNGAVIMAGISAIDIALWDIKGKALNRPVHDLLGGKMRDRIRSYASQIQFDWAPDSRTLTKPEEYAEAALKAIADGYDCIKVDPIGFNMCGEWMGSNNFGLLSRPQLDMAYQRMAAIREACGPDVDIILELHCLTDRNTSIQLGHMLEPFNCFYCEEPTIPLNPDLMKQISESINVPIASGERIYSRWGFRPFLENHSLSIIQPDLGNTGGLSEGKKICDMAHIYDVGVQLHVCGGPLATAAALQLEAVIPNFIIHEHHTAAIRTENSRMCKYDYQPINGFFNIPNLPGIGQELTEETIAKAERVSIS